MITTTPQHHDLGFAYESTSERMLVEAYQADPADYLIYCCHVATYDFARPLVAGGRVLDFGCGTGYGTHRLAPHCREVVGVDISADAIGHAARTYEAPNLRYQRIGPLPHEPLPFDDASFDSVVSFQVIEHIADTDAYFSELRRVLRPGGTIVIATPDRATRLFRGQRPWNIYHLFELDGPDLAARAGRHFEDVHLFQMSARPEVAAIELRRARKLRLATYPFTFPGAPERWRTFGLRTLKRLQARRSGDDGGAAAAAPDHGFGPEDVTFAETDEPGLNIVVTATR